MERISTESALPIYIAYYDVVRYIYFNMKTVFPVKSIKTVLFCFKRNHDCLIFKRYLFLIYFLDVPIPVGFR